MLKHQFMQTTPRMKLKRGGDRDPTTKHEKESDCMIKIERELQGKMKLKKKREKENRTASAKLIKESKTFCQKVKKNRKNCSTIYKQNWLVMKCM